MGSVGEMGLQKRMNEGRIPNVWFKWTPGPVTLIPVLFPLWVSKSLGLFLALCKSFWEQQ